MSEVAPSGAPSTCCGPDLLKIDPSGGDSILICSPIFFAKAILSFLLISAAVTSSPSLYPVLSPSNPATPPYAFGSLSVGSNSSSFLKSSPDLTASSYSAFGFAFNLYNPSASSLLPNVL